MKPFTLLVAGLAGQRAAQALSADKVSEPIRNKVLMWSISDDQTPEQYERRAKINQLIHCPHCTGFWLTAITVATYALASRYRHRRTARGIGLVVEWWAAASIQTVVMAAWAMFSDVAHHAEIETKIAEHKLAELQTPRA